MFCYFAPPKKNIIARNLQFIGQIKDKKKYFLGDIIKWTKTYFIFHLGESKEAANEVYQSKIFYKKKKISYFSFLFAFCFLNYEYWKSSLFDSCSDHFWKSRKINSCLRKRRDYLFIIKTSNKHCKWILIKHFQS